MRNSGSYQVTGLTKDPQDDSDYIYEWSEADVLPDSIDLRHYTSTVEDQLSVGSCTAQATVGAAEMFLVANKATPFTDMSRLFNYFTARSYLPQEYQDNDKGSIARFNLKAANKWGICSEHLHPYYTSNWNTKPSEAAYSDALKYKVGAYYRILTLGPNWTFYPAAKAIKHALAKGFPVVVGMIVGEQLRHITLENPSYTYVNPNTNPSIGGHEMLIVGYTGDSFIVRNSWGTGWGDKGYFYCPQDVLINDVLDLWVVQGFAGYSTIGPDNTVSASLVTRMYQQALRRAPDAGGLAYWQTKSQRVAMQGICSSEEFFLVNKSITDLYKAILGREPDVDGLAYWNSTGLPLGTVAAAFMASDEFKSKYPDSTTAKHETLKNLVERCVRWVL